MTLHLPTLNFISIAMLAMSAGIITVFGSSGRVYRGFWWWAAAQWMLALGLLLHTIRESHAALLPAALGRAGFGRVSHESGKAAAQS